MLRHSVKSSWKLLLRAWCVALKHCKEIEADFQPVVGLDAEGTRDLVQDTQTGLLLPLPSTSVTWPTTLKNPSTAIFDTCAVEYAKLLARAVTDHDLRTAMGQRAATEGIKGFTWWDAMESCVDGYRESIRIHRHSNSSEKAAVAGAEEEGEGKTSRVNRMNRVVSRSLAHRDAKRPDTRETIWHLSTSTITRDRNMTDG